jgi:hypothetical protein
MIFTLQQLQILLKNKNKNSPIESVPQLWQYAMKTFDREILSDLYFYTQKNYLSKITGLAVYLLKGRSQ